MHNDHAQFDARKPLPFRAKAPRAKSKWPLLAAGGIGGAIVGWFMPLGLVESVTSAVGLSEMIPALAPPLGSTMRALLALGGGVSAMALVAAFMGGAKKKPAAMATRTDPRPDVRPRAETEIHDSYGEHPMARQSAVRQSDVRPSRTDRDMEFDDQAVGAKAAERGGFFTRVKQSMAKLPLPRRFDAAEDGTGPIRDFSDLKRLRPGGDRDGQDMATDDRAPRHEVRRDDARRDDQPMRPIAAHAELGEPLPPITAAPNMAPPIIAPSVPLTNSYPGQLQPAPFAHDTFAHDHGDDLAELERSARAAAERFAPQGPVAQPAPPVVEAAPAPAPIIETPVQNLAPAVAPASYDADGIEALVVRLERALANVRPVAIGAETATETPVAAPEPELDLAAFAEEQRAAEQDALRRAEVMAAQDIARKAAEEADRAAEEAQRRAAEAQALLASLGVSQPETAPAAAAPHTLHAVADSTPKADAGQPDMDDALRSALRTLRRMSHP